MKSLIIFILLSFQSISSSSTDNTLHKTQIIGSWIFFEDVSNDTFFSIKKVKKLDHDKPGIVFKKNGKLIKRQNSGWCGTPPIAYANYDGTWELRKNTLSLKYSFNNGEMEEEWEIIERKNSILIYKLKNTKTINNKSILHHKN